MIYNKNLDKIYSDLGETEVGETILDNSKPLNTEETSLQVGKTVEEQLNEIGEVNEQNQGTIEVNLEENEQPVNNANTNVENNEEQKSEKPKEQKKEEPKEPVFILPVEGTLMKEFAKDKLVYSETLKEWVTHTGADIKAEKTTVVKAAEKRKSNSNKK